MSPRELKEWPKESEDELDEVAILISDDEDVAGIEEPEPPEDSDAEPLLVDVENDEEGDEEAPDEEDDDVDDEDDETSEGGKADDDDSDDEEDKNPLNDSDDDEEDNDIEMEVANDDETVAVVDDEEEEVDTDRTSVRKGKSIAGKRPGIGRGKVIPGVSFPLTSKQEYKGDIEDLLRAAAQADEGEPSSANTTTTSKHDGCEVTEVTIKNDTECAVVDVLDGEEEEAKGSAHKDNTIDFVKDSVVKQGNNMADDGPPPVKRIKSS